MVGIAFFDWNGTMLNDSLIWYEAVKEIFRIYGKRPPTMEEYFRELQHDYMNIYISRGIEPTRGIEALRADLNAIYEPYYASLVGGVELFKGVQETLQFLSGRGMAIGLVTMQKEDLVRPLLEKFGIDSFFAHQAFHMFEKGAYVQQILIETGVNPHNCFFVGDTPSDMRHAQTAGIRTVAFLNGYIPVDMMVACRPDFFAKNFQEIRVIVPQLQLV